MQAYVLIKTNVGETVSVVNMLRQIKGVKAANVTFGPYDAIALIEAGTLNAVGDLITELVRGTPGVVDTITCLIVDT